MLNTTRRLSQALLAAAALAPLGGVTSAATPAQQQAILQTGTGGPEILKLQTVPVPAAGAGQVLVRVYAASVNAAEWKSRAAAAGYAPAAATIIPGGDVAGVVEQLGAGVTGLKVGDPVFAVIARKPAPLNGGYAQFALTEARNVVPKPANLTYAEASTLGIATITAVRAVTETRLARGERILITGVAGGVGSAAAQAAKARGAYVIGTATARHNDFLKGLGVDAIIDYSQVKFEDKTGKVDVVLDTVGGDTTVRAMGTLKPGGRFLSVGARDYEAHCRSLGIECVARASASDAPRAIYEEVAALATAGKIKVKIDKSFPLAEAGRAQAYGEEGHTEGKIVLIVDAANANRR